MYGQAIGIIMLETSFPRIPGDIGNATTWDFPVVYRTVRGSGPEKVVGNGDSEGLKDFIEAAYELERAGVRAITTSCGFLALFQKELADSVRVPLYTSSLMQVPLIKTMLREDQKVGIITVSAASLTKRHLACVGADNVPVVIKGTEEGTVFTRTILEDRIDLDIKAMRNELVEAGRIMVEEHPEVGAIVLECTNMPPYARELQEATGLPVFDIYTLTKLVYHSVVRTAFRGFL